MLGQKKVNAVKKTECDIVREFGELELNSTAYMLRVLTKSIIGEKENIKFKFVKDKELAEKKKKEITGRWSNDAGLINIITTQGTNVTKSNDGMLIMGLGPSASGKSFMANKIIEIMKEIMKKPIDNGYTFPDFFFNIDGGKYRELSVVYQSVIKGIKQYSNNGQTDIITKCINDNVGMNNQPVMDKQQPVMNNQSEIEIGGGDPTCSSCNLSSKPSDYLALNNYKGIINLKDYIDTSKIKNEVKGYLNGQRLLHKSRNNKLQNNKLQINLYVPDTLVSCGSGYDRCMRKIKEYVKITNSQNRWISTLIYQHKIGEDKCPYYKPDESQPNDRPIYVNDTPIYDSPPPISPPPEPLLLDNESYETYIGGISKLNKNLMETPTKNLMCNGTIKSGVEREKCESKIYDDSNWDKGYDMGLKYTERGTYRDTYTPGLVLRIHNSGDKNRQSTLESVKFRRRLL
jgi:hypothetical protein